MRTAIGLILALALGTPALAQDASAAFFADNAKAAGVHTIPGIQYRVLKSGPADGSKPRRTSTIKVRYEGKFLNGQVFDSSKDGPEGTATFPLNRLISGWTTMLPMMRPGDEWIIWLPPEYAYGAAGKDIIPPSTPLEFRIELVEVLPD